MTRRRRERGRWPSTAFAFEWLPGVDDLAGVRMIVELVDIEDGALVVRNVHDHSWWYWRIRGSEIDNLFAKSRAAAELLALVKARR